MRTLWFFLVLQKLAIANHNFGIQNEVLFWQVSFCFLHLILWFWFPKRHHLDVRSLCIKAVCWSFCGTEATTDQGQLESFLENLCSSTDAFMKSLSNVSLLLTSISTSPKTVELCIDFLATILESSTTKNLFDSEHWLLEQNDFFRLKDFLQVNPV